MRATTIFLLAVMLSAQSPLGQLLKLPVLIGHFQKHQKNNGKSFIEFLNEHYSSGHDDADLPEDEQLPFKTLTFFSIGFAILAPVQYLPGFTIHSSERKIVFRKADIPQLHTGSIFHPPRMS